MNDRALLGCLLGTAAGDAIGLPYEGLSKSRARRLLGPPERHRFLLRRGMVSDDTEHAMLVARAFARSGGEPDRFARLLARSLRLWLLGLPAGVGFATLRAILRLWIGFDPDKSGVHSAGNGPAMRAPPLGVLAADDASLRALVLASTRVTHSDPKAFHGAYAVALAARIAAQLRATDGEQFMAELTERLPDCDPELGERLPAMAQSLLRGEGTAEFAASLGLGKGVSGYVCHTVPVCLHAWLAHQDDFATAVATVIGCGGDADTTAAIVGGIVGAGVGPDGIPQPWLDGLAEWPCGVRWLRAQVECIAAGRAVPRVPFFRRLPRNALFTVVVLVHGFRRLLPPY